MSNEIYYVIMETSYYIPGCDSDEIDMSDYDLTSDESCIAVCKTEKYANSLITEFKKENPNNQYEVDAVAYYDK